MKSLFLCLLLMLTSRIYSQKAGMNVILQSQTASQRTAYLISVTIFGDNGDNKINITAGTSTSLIFPSEYNNRLTTGNYVCSIGIW